MEGDLSVCTSELMTRLRHISLESSDLATKERLIICCKPSYRLTRIKSKGAILVLVWSYLCTSVLYFGMKMNKDNHGVEFLVATSNCILFEFVHCWVDS